MRVPMDPDLNLALRSAWLSLIGGHTHEAIAARLGVSRTKVTRLIQTAQDAGFVKVSVEGAPAECVALEDALMATHGLRNCSVAPDLGEGGVPLATLGALGAQILCGLVARPGLDVIGIGHGRALAAAVDALPILTRPDLKLVSLLGSLTRTAATTPFDVIFRFAQRTGGTGYYMPAPFFCDSATDQAVLLAQRDLQPVRDLAARASVVVVGIGALDQDYGLLHSGMVTATEFDALKAAGAAGEILGTFIDAQGRPLDVELNRRVIATDPASLRGREVVAIAGGPGKDEAIRAALRNGLISHLVTDERTARALLGKAERRRRNRIQDRPVGLASGSAR